jgi:hypothetical protein
MRTQRETPNCMSHTRTRYPHILAAAVAIPLCMLLACKPTGKPNPDQGLLLSVTLPAKAYMMDRVRASGSGEQELVFPSLQIYNSSGLLVYKDANSTRNVNVLESLPFSMRGLQPIQGEAPLVRLVEAIPEFQTRKDDIVRGQCPTVVSVDLAGCEGCSVQTEALDAMTADLRMQPMNVLFIHVRQP